MKQQPLWAQTLAWMAAVIAALLLALAGPESIGPSLNGEAWSHGATAPR